MVMRKGIRDSSWEHNGQQQQGQLGLCSCTGRWIIGHRRRLLGYSSAKKSGLLTSEVWDNMKKWLMTRGVKQILTVKKTTVFLFPSCRGGKDCYWSFGEKETDETEGGMCYLFDPECDAHDRRWINILLLLCLLLEFRFPWVPGLASLSVPMALGLVGHTLVSHEEDAARLLCRHLDKDWAYLSKLYKSNFVFR